MFLPGDPWSRDLATVGCDKCYRSEIMKGNVQCWKRRRWQVDTDLCAVRGPADEYARFLPAAAACKVRLERAVVARVARPPRAAARIAMVDMSAARRIGRVHGLRCYLWHLDPQSPYSPPPLDETLNPRCSCVSAKGSRNCDALK